MVGGKSSEAEPGRGAVAFMWIPFTDPRSNQVWQISQEGLYLLCRANARANLIIDNSSVETHDGGLVNPNTFLVQTDWDSVRKSTDSATLTLFNDAETRIAIDGVANMVINLAALRLETTQKTKALESMQAKAQSDTFFSINATINGLEVAEDFAKFVRDASATALLAGAAVLTGGVALEVVAGASALKGVATFQDTGNVGAAVVQATGTFVVGALPIKAPGVVFSSAQDKILVFVASGMDGMFTGVEAVAEGKSGSIALKQAAARAGLDALVGMSGLKLENMSTFVKVSANTVGNVVADVAVGAIPPKPKPPPAAQIVPEPDTSGTTTFAAAIGNSAVTDQQFVSSFVLRKAP
jgi:hypothetical protein